MRRPANRSLRRSVNGFLTSRALLVELGQLAGHRIGVQFERTVRDWISYQVSYALTGGPAAREGLLDYHEGARLRDILRHVDDEAHLLYDDDPATDRLEVFALSVDWDAPENSALTQLPDVVVADYNSWLVDYSVYYSVPQPGVEERLDPIREVILNRMSVREGRITLPDGMSY